MRKYILLGIELSLLCVASLQSAGTLGRTASGQEVSPFSKVDPEIVRRKIEANRIKRELEINKRINEPFAYHVVLTDMHQKRRQNPLLDAIAKSFSGIQPCPQGRLENYNWCNSGTSKITGWTVAVGEIRESVNGYLVHVSVSPQVFSKSSPHTSVAPNYQEIYLFLNGGLKLVQEGEIPGASRKVAAF